MSTGRLAVYRPLCCSASSHGSNFSFRYRNKKCALGVYDESWI